MQSLWYIKYILVFVSLGINMFIDKKMVNLPEKGITENNIISGEYFQKLFGNNTSNHFGKGIAYNNFYYIIGGNNGMATLTKLSNTGDHIWTSEVNGTSGWNDIIVNSDGNILLVGIYGAFDGMAESMIGVANGNTGAFISLKSYDFNVRESLTKIYLNPNPASTLYPYYVAGIQNLASGGVDDVTITTIDKNGNVGTRNLLDSNDDEFYRDISSDGNNGEIILTGNRAALTNNGVTVTLDKNGQVLSGRLFNVNTTFNSILTKQNLFSGNNHILAGRNNTSSIAQIVKVNGNSLVFSHNITQLNTITRLYPMGLSNFIAIGYGTFSGVNRPVMVQMTDIGNSLTINWAKTFNDGENQYGFGFGNLISPNKYIYTDARNGNSDGFGDMDAFISIDSISLDNCIDQPVNVSLSNVTVSFSAFNPTSSTIESVSSVNRTATLIPYNTSDICAETCEVSFTTSNPSCGRVVFTSSTNLSGTVTYNWTFGTVPTLSSNIASPTHTYANNGTYLVCLTVSNGISTCQICKNVSVNNSDNTPPLINCPQNIFLSTNQDQCFVTYIPLVVITDNCDSETTCNCIMSGATSGLWIKNTNGFFNVGLTTITCTATDDGGNSSVCSFNIKVFDSKPPVIQCPPAITFPCGANPDSFEFGMATTTDNCPGVNITYTEMVFGNNCNRFIDRIWRATDQSGSIVSCVQRISFVDSEPPDIICPSDVTVSCTALTLPEATGYATAKDSCQPNITISFKDLYSGTKCNQIIHRTWTSIDPCGNQTQCIQTITKTDNVPPEIICPADVTLNCLEDISPMSVGTAIATDHCQSILNVAFSDAQSGSECERFINRTWSATDSCGNTALCVQMIHLSEDIRLDLVCPVDITIDCNDSSAPENTGTALVTGNCTGEKNISFIDVTTDNTCRQIITRTWTATDGCGNSSICIQTITKQDNTAPAITCPANVTIDCTGSTLPTNTGIAMATDNCQNTVQISHQDIKTGTSCDSIITRTWTATDGCSNTSVCIQTITKQDDTVPVITCPANVTIDCYDLSLPNITGMATATDNCQNSVQIIHQDIKTGTSCDSIITRTWTATDGCGNTSVCIQTITKQDNTSPVITCPANVTIHCTSSSLPVITGTATATDNCQSNVAISYTDVKSGTSCDSTITRTWVASDGCGNTSTCVQSIRKRDTTPPSITCPANVTINCSTSSLPSTTGTATATDICQSNVVVSYSDVKSGTSCDSIITRTWTASDGCGNTFTCVQSIRKRDTTPPIITCPANVTLGCNASTLPGITGAATATDDCQINLIITFTDVKTGTFCDSTIVRTWSVSDVCGQSASCQQFIYKKENVALIMVCPSNKTLDCTMSADTTLIGVPLVTGNCPGNITVSFIDLKSGAGCDSIITRNWKAVDACGNTAVCTQTIQISGGQPVFSDCGRKYVMDGQNGVNGCGSDIIVLTPEISNPCGSDVMLTNNINNTSDASGYYTSGITYVQWEATKLCGLKAFCQDTIIVTPCDTLSCCTPMVVFDHLITKGFTFVTDECSVTVSTTQFNDCHYFTSYPDFSDGSVVLNDTIPANGSWTYTFAQTGQYTVCVDVIETGDGGKICYKAKMCTEFIIPCTVDPLSACCKDTLGFNQHFVSNISYIKDGCLVCFPMNAADSCDVISVEFGDLSNPVVFDGDSICHSFAEKGIYDVCISSERYDPKTSDICLAKDTCISISISCDPNELCNIADIKVPNGLTPNGDNINDVLRIIKPASCRKIEISIYNRWGQLVWAQADCDNTWDGQSLNGNILPDGTYYLILSLPAPDTEIRSFKTFIDIRTK